MSATRRRAIWSCSPAIGSTSTARTSTSWRRGSHPAPSDAISPDTDVFSLSDDGTVAVVVHPNTTHNYAELYSLSTLTKRLLDLGPLPQPNDDRPDDVALSPRGESPVRHGGDPQRQQPHADVRHDHRAEPLDWTGRSRGLRPTRAGCTRSAATGTPPPCWGSTPRPGLSPWTPRPRAGSADSD